MADDAGAGAGAHELPGLNHYGWTASEEGISFYFVVFLSLLALVLVLSKALHDRPRLASFLPEAGMTILVGIFAGYLVSALVRPAPVGAEDDDGGGGEDDSVIEGLLSFNPKVFFIALLPPIIFNSGYRLRRELFFRHMKPIVLFACAGTAVSTAVIAIILQIVTSAGLVGDFQPRFSELLTFGALVSATDPVSTLAVFQAKRVDPQLFYLVFGESVLNDAVGLVLFSACGKFVGNNNGFGTVTLALVVFCLDFLFSFVGSLLLGLLSGILAAKLLKEVDMRRTGLLEVSLYVLVMYLPFFLAEIMHLSGIVTILFTGVSARRYAVPNLSSRAESESDALFRVSAHLAETAIFLELGLSVFGLASYGNYHWRFISWALAACLMGRACNVYPIAFLYNRTLWMTEGEEDRHSQGGGDDDFVNAEVIEEGMEEQRTRRSASSVIRRSNGNAQNDEKTAPIIGSALSESSEQTRTPYSRRDQKIELNTATMLWFSGLRGAVAYACAKTFPNSFGNRMSFIITTMVIVLVTVFLLGGATEVALNVLNIDMGVDEDEYTRAEGERLNFGILGLFEERYVCPFVVRDHGVPQTLGREGSEGSGVCPPTHSPMPVASPPSLSPHNSYEGHVEMTIGRHLDIVSEMENTPEEAKRRKGSLYDYGLR